MRKTAEHIRALDKAERALEKVKRGMPCELMASYCCTVRSPRLLPSESLDKLESREFVYEVPNDLQSSYCDIQMKRAECVDKCDSIGTRWGWRDRLAALKDTLYELRVADDRLDVCLQVSAIASVAREAVGILDRATAVPQHRVEVCTGLSRAWLRGGASPHLKSSIQLV